MEQQRRRFIATSSLGAVAALVSSAATAQTSGRTNANPTAPVATDKPMRLTPQVTEGPFYLDLGLMRTDITEGIRGVPLEVRIVVVDASGAPLRSRVDLWHCDPSGLYSGFDGQGADRATRMRGKTFLRGSVVADGDGVAAFETVYPGWYAGRSTHSHLKVFSGARVVLTSQLFLPDALSEYLYTNLSAYRRATLRDTLNRGDGIALEAGDGAFGAVREQADRYVLTATTIIDPSARPVAERPGPGPGPGHDGPPGAPNGPGMPGRGDGPDGRGGPPPGGPFAGPMPPDRPAILQGTARVAAIVPGSGVP